MALSLLASSALGIPKPLCDSRLSCDAGISLVCELIAGLADAKGSCSCRLYDASTGRFIRKLPNARGSFRTAFSHVIREGKEFRPSYQPDLVSTEKYGLPSELLIAEKLPMS